MVDVIIQLFFLYHLLILHHTSGAVFEDNYTIQHEILPH